MKECLICKKQLRSSQKKFCSSKCLGKYFKLMNIKPPNQIGFKHSNETKKIISKKMTGRKGTPNKYKGTKRPDYVGKKISEAKRGVQFTEEHRNKLSIAKIGVYRGEKSHFWRGGVSKVNKIIRYNIIYKKWVKDVFKRDNYTCQECKQLGGKLVAHHIIPFAKIINSLSKKYNTKYLKEQYHKCQILWDINNGQTLCIDCHKKTDSFGNNFYLNYKII